jgi:hypothetical protein
MFNKWFKEINASLRNFMQEINQEKYNRNVPTGLDFTPSKLVH